MFKTACFVYKCLSGQAPVYLSELLEMYRPTRSLRSENKKQLSVPKFRISLCEKAFAVGGPKVWNNLDLNTKDSFDLKMFKKKLKTNLFSSVYGQ